MRRHHTMITTDWVVMKPTTQVIDLFTPEQFSTTGHQFPLFTCAYKMSGYTFQMRSSKYILWQDDNGWRGYLEGYPEYEVQGESFEELQVKLWQLHQELSGQHQESELIQDQDRYQQSDPKESARSHSQTPTLPRPISRAQSKRRARVEELMFAMISNR